MSLRNKFHISEEDKLVISVGWLFERKGFDTFCRSCKRNASCKNLCGLEMLDYPTQHLR